MKHQGNLVITSENSASFADLEEVSGSLEISSDAKLDAVDALDGDVLDGSDSSDASKTVPSLGAAASFSVLGGSTCVQ